MTSHSNKNTKALAEKLAVRFSKNNKKSRILALSGDLGSGKTFFTRAFLKALGVKEKITSPTFVIMREYALRRGMFKKAYHLDVYRLKPEDLAVIGFKKILKEKHAIIIIEWAEKIRKLLPQNTYWIYFSHGKKENERYIRIS